MKTSIMDIDRLYWLAVLGMLNAGFCPTVRLQQSVFGSIFLGLTTPEYDENLKRLLAEVLRGCCRAGWAGLLPEHASQVVFDPTVPGCIPGLMDLAGELWPKQAKIVLAPGGR